jgi:hypothetical protein
MLVFSFSISLLAHNRLYSNKKITTHSNYIDLKNNIHDAANASALIVTGTVKSQYSYKLYGVMFTNYVINITKVLKQSSNATKLPDKIEVRVTGGQLNGETEPFEDFNGLNNNDRCLFLLNKTFIDKPENNFYTPVGGGFQGIIVTKQDKEGNDIVTKVNEKNIIENQVIGKGINDLNLGN